MTAAPRGTAINVKPLQHHLIRRLGGALGIRALQSGPFVDSLDLLTHARGFDELLSHVGSEKPADATRHDAQKPGPYYDELIARYQALHAAEKSKPPTDEQIFNGSIMKFYLPQLKELIIRTRADSLLDYGAGSGKSDWIRDQLGLSRVHCFEPGLGGNTAAEAEKFDVVTCFDVLEHIHISDLFWVINDIFTKADRMVFCSVSTRLARLRFLDGSQVHITINPAAWWRGIFDLMGSQHPGIRWILVAEGPDSRGFETHDWFTNRDSTSLHCFYSD